MAASAQDKISEIDVSDRLRLLMRDHKLTVWDMAKLAGVSKSTMEKYLAGPSSPRATALYAICEKLGVNAHWLLFGLPDDDLRIIHTVVEDVLVDLLNELKQGGEIADPFARYSFGTSDWRLFTYELSDQRAREAIERILREREAAVQRFKEGQRVASVGPFPLVRDLD